MPAKIRTLSPGDAEDLFELRRQALVDSPLAFMSSPEDDFAASVASVRDFLGRGIDSPVFGACDPRLVGMVGLYRDRHVKAAHKVHLWGMYVRPESRQQGLGHQLLDQALDHARKLDGVRLVHVSVGETAADAKSLYERAGFHVWGTEPEALCYDGRCMREFHMVLPLT
jgi:ribosomal protein S18 acetylase RimI-like enzyme